MAILIKTFAATLQSIHAIPVTIETFVTRGCGFNIVGLADTAIKESYDRIMSVSETLGMKFKNNRTVINLSPANIRKEGSAFDLPLFVSLLLANKNLPIEADGLENYMMMGELQLDGSLRGIKGALPIAIKAKEMGLRAFILPYENAREAAVVEGITIYGAKTIHEVIDFFKGNDSMEEFKPNNEKLFYSKQCQFPFDFSEVKGQENIKRALEVAAAGGHNIILIGSPGSGKSMLAKRMPSILPPFTIEESLETTKIYSVAGKLERNVSLLTTRPFRSPHHNISVAALVGGGTYPQPGEISLSHNGVLFLDELAEFNRNVLEVMRQPLEDRKVTVSRARYAVDYPAGFMLVAAMNPCPCGYYNHPTRACECAPGAVQKYLGKISGPLLDRIDIQVEVIPVPFEKLTDVENGEPSEKIRERVIKAREIQSARFKGSAIHCNAEMTPAMTQKFARPNDNAMKILQTAMNKMGLSARAYDRILKVARTIADLSQSDEIDVKHIAEAIGYRNLDRSSWGN